ncbi:MAG: hypothetical protein HYZ22_20735 [Chloroflexi bacterium]|nr:hypothetical protein [Chloroflexota bacterium]
MPRLSMYFVRASLVYLTLAATIGGLLLANKGIMISPAIWSLLPLHIEFAFVGWMIQLAMGVAFWILPRFSHGALRGDERLSWLAITLLNTGIFLLVLQSLLGSDWLAFAGRIMELLALTAFAIGNWKRIKPMGA